MKRKIRQDVFKPPTYYSEGHRKLNILHSRLRHQCSSLNADLFKVNIANDPKCSCGAPYEDAIHFLLECPLYHNERNNLLIELRNLEMNIETLLFGNDAYNNQTNSKIFEKVRVYIKQTKRF